MACAMAGDFHTFFFFAMKPNVEKDNRLYLMAIQLSFDSRLFQLVFTAFTAAFLTEPSAQFRHFLDLVQNVLDSLGRESIM
jgi:hypothetical protein